MDWCHHWRNESIFIRITILIRIIQLPWLDMYWQTTNPLTTTSGVSSIMSRIHFQQIFHYLHDAYNAHQIPADQPGHDKLCKVCKLLDILTWQFQSNYKIIKYIIIDEAMIPFKGRLGLINIWKISLISETSRFLNWAMQQMVVC